MVEELFFLTAAVEGDTDEAVLRRVAAHAGGSVANVYGRMGKQKLLQRVGAYNRAAQFSPWVVLVDLDASEPCAPPARAQWLPELQAFMCFRLAVRESEAWLLADQEAIARYLAVGAGLVPNDPESLPDPKATVVDLARRSSRRSIREDIVPVEGSGRSVGPGYVARLIDFAANHWRVDAAASVSDSLARAVRCLEALRARWVDSLQGA